MKFAGLLDLDALTGGLSWRITPSCMWLWQLWDVPTEEYHAVEPLVFRDVRVVVLTFTLLKQGTFDLAKELFHRMTHLRDKHATQTFRESMGRKMNKPLPVILVAAKCDIFDEQSCKFYGEVSRGGRRKGGGPRRGPGQKCGQFFSFKNSHCTH